MQDNNNTKDVTWASLLNQATKEPGLLHQCYSMLHQYSLGNLLLAAIQLNAKGLEFGPISTFGKWKEVGRHVKRGEKALSLWMPVSVRVKKVDESGEEVETDKKRMVFVLKNNWFALSQTDGKEYQPVSTPEWDFAKALQALDIKLVAYDRTYAAANPNCQGYASDKTIAISPIAQKPLATQFHELAHVVLGHTAGEAMVDGIELSRSVKEMEAEATAMLCLDVLGHSEMAVYCRGYIQNWAKGQAISDASAKRIFSAADKILKAGQIQAAEMAA